MCLPNDSQTAYAALSHCWGLGLPLKTVKANLTEHMMGIKVDTLPKTYRDTVEIVKELGLNYVWIDSLCIVQDDAADWEREAAQMGSVYGCAQLTVIAAWGSEGQAGCFHDSIPPFHLDILGRTGTSVGERPNETRLYTRPIGGERQNWVLAPLNQRAWTFQERLLSSRSISFCADQMRWACASVTKSEDSVEYDNTTELAILFQKPDDRDGSDRYLFSESWIKTVHDYSSRSLTFASDKFAAIAGAVAAHQRAFHEIPLVGLWENDIATGLLWHSLPGVHPTLDTDAIRALNIPSWSWLKLRGEVSCYHISLEQLLKDTKGAVTWTGRPHVSKLLDTSILCRGKLLNVLKMEKPTHSDCICGTPDTIRLGIEGKPRNIPVYIWLADKCADSLPENLSCLLVGNDQSPGVRVVDENFMKISALILTAVETRGITQTYQRVGLIRFQRFPRDVFEQAGDRQFILV